MAEKELSQQDIESILNTIDDFIVMSKGEQKEKRASTEAMEEQETAASQPVRVQEINRDGLRESQIAEIDRGEQQGLQTEIYAKACYNWMQMREIRLGLLQGLDTGLYDNPLYSAGQMKELRLGLELGLNISNYASLIYAVSDMKRRRRKLLAEHYKEAPDSFARTIMDEDTRIELRISADYLEAFMKIPGSSNRQYTVRELKRILHEYEICHGIKEEPLKQLAEQGLRDNEVLVARGDAVSSGRDGSYRLFFKDVFDEGPLLLPDGGVDYSNVSMVDSVSPGRVLAQYNPAEKGQAGRLVNGLVIEGYMGKDLEPLSGIGIKVDLQRGIYFAAEKGFVSYNDTVASLNVCDVFIIKGDADYSKHNLFYDGSIYVTGNVKNNVVLKAGCDLIIDGFVEGAYIRAGNNVVIKGGVNAGGKGQIDAGGGIKGRFFESANLKAKGAIEGNYFLNCNIETDYKLIAKGQKARIMGGSITAALAVESSVIGNEVGSKTILNVGDTVWLAGREAQLEREAKEIRDEILRLMEGKNKLRALFGEQETDLYQQTCEAIAIKVKQEAELSGDVLRLSQLRVRAQNAYIYAYSRLQQDVSITIDGIRRLPEETERGVKLTKGNINRRK